MPREKEGFRDNLERLDKAFPGKELLNQKDVVVYTGLSPHTVQKYLTPVCGTMYAKVAIAKWLAQ
nr:MAG TPA: excisionase [Caudoviricetes sp.]